MASPSFFCYLLLHFSFKVMTSYAIGTGKFRAILIFGDSTVDTGNNNYVPTLFRANHSPYGINFINGLATGRFSDGWLVPDLLASGLGIKDSVPPFLYPQLSDQDVVTGVNFASAGSGLDELTTAASGVIPVSKHLKMFKRYLERLEGIVGREEASEIVGESLILISAGTNDFVFNYYDIPTRRLQFNISGYQDFVLQKLQTAIKKIYDMGGRKFIIPGLAPIGCIPLHRVANLLSDRSCKHDQNTDAVDFNVKLKNLLTTIQTSLRGIRLKYGNIYDPVVDIINNPAHYGFKETKRGCCGVGFLEVGPLCNVITPACRDASQFVFWDAVHPSQSVCKIVARNFMDELVPSLLHFSNV
ncbi:GDSL esterase/lipase At2g31540-like [Aristolochia californica]|uniref:GDSL esterase/lipase At2g31540-like n=1 Tax=Aristolochia californica TaxID=171875 RepID=UPI0035D82CE2